MGIPKDGIYRLRWADPDTAIVHCAEVDGSPAAGFFPADDCETYGGAYVFRILLDCNSNGIKDSIDILNDPSLDEDPENGIIDDCDDVPFTCMCDWDENGIIQVPDIFAFLSAWFAGCTGSISDPPSCNGKSADFDLSGTVAVPDIFEFLSCWFAAIPDEPC